MHDSVRAAVAGARRLYATQVRLQQGYLDRNGQTGADAYEASRWLRWHDLHLVGDLLPPTDRRPRRADG